MPVPGRKPKPSGEAVTRHKPVHEWTEIENVHFNDAPKLPARRQNGQVWPRTAKTRWADWSTMPHCVLWMASDWDFAVQTLELSVQLDEGKITVATEVRNRGKVLGLTWDARRDLRIRYVEPKTEKLAAVVNADDYRELYE